MLAGGQTRDAHMGQTDPPRKSFLPLGEIFFCSVVYVALTATFSRQILRRFSGRWRAV